MNCSQIVTTMQQDTRTKFEVYSLAAINDHHLNAYSGRLTCHNRLEKEPPNNGQDGSEERRARFALAAAIQIRGMQNCLFSLVPQGDLVRVATEWFQASAEATLRCNYHPIEQWVRNQAAKAAEEGFALDDLLGVLRACRQCAIEVERWNEDALSPVDDIVNETLSSLQGSVVWKIPAGINYLSQKKESPAPLVTDTQSVSPGLVHGDRRTAGRCHVRLPIRLRTKSGPDQGSEVTKTSNVSRTGISFTTAKNYDLGVVLFIVYPYWGTEDSFNKEYKAKVVRKERLPEGGHQVAVHFLDSLGHRSDPITTLRAPNQLG